MLGFHLLIAGAVSAFIGSILTIKSILHQPFSDELAKSYWGKNPFRIRNDVIQQVEAVTGTIFMAISFLLVVAGTLLTTSGITSQNILAFAGDILVYLLLGGGLLLLLLDVTRHISRMLYLPRMVESHAEGYWIAVEHVTNEGLTQEEIARQTRIPQETRDSRLTEANRRLEQIGKLVDLPRFPQENLQKYIGRLQPLFVKNTASVPNSDNIHERSNHMADCALVRCSNACTRAGITAILLSAVLFAIGPQLKEVQIHRDKIEYAKHRASLSESVEFLVLDPCLQIWAHINKEQLDQMTLERVSAIDCTRIGGLSRQWLQKDVESQDKATSPNDKATSPNSPAFREPATYAQEPEALSDQITNEFLGVLMTHARLRSDGTLFVISPYSLAWENRLALRLAERNWIPDKDRATEHALHTRRGQTMPITQKDLRTHLSVGAAKEIANYQKPDLTTESNLLSHFNVDLPEVAIPIDMQSAIFLLQGLLFLSLVLFLLYQKEARTVATSSIGGSATLFSIFQQSNKTKNFFIFLCALPALASGLSLLSFQSLWKVPWPNSLFFVLILYLGARIAYDFRKFR